VDDGGYIDIMPVGGYMYVPVYDPYVVFARPRPGFFVGGAIRFGGGFRWASGYNRFDWRSHQVFVNRRAWTPPARPMYREPQRPFVPRQFEQNRSSFTGGANREWNRNFTAPAAPAPAQRNFAPAQPPRDFGRQMQQRNFNAPAPAPIQQRNFAPAPQRQMEQRNFTPQPRNGGGFNRGGEGRGHGR
jgi:hypothetical protein